MNASLSSLFGRKTSGEKHPGFEKFKVKFQSSKFETFCPGDAPGAVSLL